MQQWVIIGALGGILVAATATGVVEGGPAAVAE